MSQYLLEYHPVNPTTWAYLSSLLMIGLFFKFGRFWSVRNLDLVLLILFAPGLLLVHYGQEGRRAATRTAAGEAAGPMHEAAAAEQALRGEPSATAVQPGPSAGARTAEARWRRSRRIERWGYLWLLGASALLVLRMLVDLTMVRRPLLEPNLTSGGLVFIGCSLFVFLMANVVNSQPTADDLEGPKSAELLLSRGTADQEPGEAPRLARHGPGNALLHFIPSLPTMPLLRSQHREVRRIAYVRTAKTMAILSHLAIVLGLVAAGRWHFNNIQMGIGAATLYLMLPYTALMTGRVDHVLPGALLVWALVSYRRPLPAGMCLGLAIGVIYYPLFLLPLWISFYWQRGLWRFLTGVASMVLVMALSQAFVSADLADFVGKLREMLGLWLPQMEGLQGVWGLGWDPFYRIPVLTAFFALSLSLAVWPAQKNLAALLSCSAAVMAATQFWHGGGGGVYLAWHVPLALLTIFRPNLEDRVALSVLSEGWLPGWRRRGARAGVEQAA